MWYLLNLWFARGPVMSEQPAVAGLSSGEHIWPAAKIVEPRTIADVEADLALAGFELNRHRSRRGDTVNTQEILAQRPALLVHELNWLLEEWSALHAAR